MERRRWGKNTREDDPGTGRDKILRAARACYSKQGMDRATLDDIAHEAGISRRTVYRYFNSKQAVIQAVVDEQALDFLRSVRHEIEDASLDFPSQLQRYIVYLVEYGLQDPGYQLLMGKKNFAVAGHYYLASKETYKLLDSLVREPFVEAVRNGEVRDDLDFDGLMAWIGRIVFSYTQIPATAEVLEMQIANFVIPALLPRGRPG